MANKTLFLVLVSASTLPLFAGSKQTQILKEDFESGAPGLKIGEHSKISSEERETISGKASLVCRAPRGAYPTAFSFSTSDCNVLEVEFNYKNLGDARSGPVVYFKDKDGKALEVRRESVFARAPGDIETSKCVFHGRSGEKCSVEVVVPQGRAFAFDNVSVKGSSAPARADWSADAAKIFETCRNHPFASHYLRPDDKILSMSRGEFFPYIDRWGQYKHRQWRDKVNSDADLKLRAEQEAEWMRAHPPIAPRDKYFGLLDPEHKYGATGKFRAQKVGGKWFFITPEGNLFYANGACTLGWGTIFSNPPTDARTSTSPTRATAFEGREEFYEDLDGDQYVLLTEPFARSYFDKPAKSFNFYARNVDLKYGGRDREKLLGLLRARAESFGINLGGHLSESDTLEAAKIPYAVTCNSAPGEWIGTVRGWWQSPPDWFSPEFEKSVKSALAEKAGLIKSPYCFGVFIDGELPWSWGRTKLASGVLACKANQSSKKKFLEILEEKYGSAEKLNAAWGSKYSSFGDFLKTESFVPQTDAGKADMLAFEETYARRYFQVCRDAIKEIDPRAMYLGCSFGMSGNSWEFAARISADYCDVVTCNTYRYNIADLKLPDGSADRPILIGEYHFAPQDKGTFGITMIPSGTSEKQAEYTREFLKSAARNPGVAGAVWFEWADLSATGRYDRADSGIGIIDMADTPHYELVETFRNFSSGMYKDRLNSKSGYGKGATDDRNWN